MGKVYLLPIFFITLTLNAFSNELAKGKKFKLEFAGFFKYYMMRDSRQTVSAREGHFLLYPESPLYDSQNTDVNSVPNFNMTTISSTLKFRLIGPEVFNAQSMTFMELDFWGSKNYYNLFRLRHAYIELKWEHFKLTIGQYWHPMSVASCFPRVVSANCGVPFHPISRNPQIRLQQDFGVFLLTGCVFTQRDFTSTGPDGADSKYLRNSGIPNMHLQLQYGNVSSDIQAGAGIDYKLIVPELYIENDVGEMFATKESLSGISYVGFISVETKYLAIKTQGVYAQNSYDMTMLGGYAEKKIFDEQTGERGFVNLNTLSVWTDMQTCGKKFFGGIFGGYSKNMGAGERIDGKLYGRGTDIKSVYRIAPRIVYQKESISISLEGEYTTANYGTENGNSEGGVTNTYSVSNFRSLLSLKYSF